MGDSGSVFLGYIFGVLLLFTVLNNEVSIWIWLIVFGYFFADTVLTQIMRVIIVKNGIWLTVVMLIKILREYLEVI